FSRHLDAQERRTLTLLSGDVMTRVPDEEALRQFPEAAALDKLKVPIQYQFAPGEASDGATLTVPLLALPQLSRLALQGLVPGYAAPRIEALLRSLPKEARRHLIPLPDAAREFLAHSQAAGVEELRHWLKERRGIAEP